MNDQWRQAPTGRWQFRGPDGYWHFSASAPSVGSGPGSADERAGVRGGAWFAITGGVLLVLGPLVPWATATAPFFGTLSRNGFQLGKHGSFSADGLICFLLGIAILAIGISRLTDSQLPKLLQRSPIVMGVIAGAVAILSAFSIGSWANSLTHAYVGSIGYGVWITLAGAVLAVVAGSMLRVAVRRASPGWYPDPAGEYRWWDGHRWGPVRMTPDNAHSGVATRTLSGSDLLRSERRRDTAVLLAIFLSFWAFLYTYSVSAWKFWLGLSLSVAAVLLAISVQLATGGGNPVSGSFAVATIVGVWLWAIVDRARTPL